MGYIQWIDGGQRAALQSRPEREVEFCFANLPSRGVGVGSFRSNSPSSAVGGFIVPASLLVRSARPYAARNSRGYFFFLFEWKFIPIKKKKKKKRKVVLQFSTCNAWQWFQIIRKGFFFPDHVPDYRTPYEDPPAAHPILSYYDN